LTTEGLDVSEIPADWNDVTPEWMTNAIAKHYPDARVSEVALLMVDNGTNRRARFGLRYDQGRGPGVVFAKAEGPFRQLHAQNGNLFNEPELFASGVPLPVDHPQPYKVLIDHPGLDYAIVMKDVTQRGAVPRDATTPMTVDQVANALQGLGRLHSQYWEFSTMTHPGLDWVQTWDASREYLGAASVSSALDEVGGLLGDQVHDIGGEQLAAILETFLASLGRGPQTLLHGDPHIGNTYLLPNGDVGFLDWQVVRRGHWSHDIGAFLVSALTVADRRSHDRDLVEQYRSALDLPNGQQPTAEEAWLRYRATPAYGLPVWLATLNARTSQRREICLNLCERYGTAFVDLNTVDAINDLKM
jgi:Phosphotransferase enzyme family